MITTCPWPGISSRDWFINSDTPHFPSDDAVIKLLWLAIRDVEDKRARAREKERGLPANQRKAPPRLVEGATVPGWTAAINALDTAYPHRINPTH